jgi:diguanylate cyclase (GGDEF)-like protein
LRERLIPMLVSLAPLASLAACIAAARAQPRGLGPPWNVLAGSAALAVASVLLYPLGSDAAATSLHTLLGVASVALFATGAGWILHLRDRLRFLEIALDAALIVAAVIVLILRWSPEARSWFAQPGPSGITPLIGILAVAIAIGCTLLFAMVLLLVRGTSPSRVVAAGFAIGSGGLSLSILPLALGFPGCCATTALTRFAFLAGWVGLGLAGLSAALHGGPAFRSVGGNLGDSRLRLVIAPGVALVMGAIVAHAASTRQLQEPTAVAFGVLSMLLAVRVTYLLFATRKLSAEREELHQSRALIELSHAVSATTDLQETLDLITQWAVRLLDGRGAAIQLVAPDAVMLEFRSIRRLPNELLKLRLPVDQSFAGWVVQHGRPRMTAEPHSDPFISDEKLRYIGNSPIAAAPLRYRDETMGALLCVGKVPFQASDLELLRALADHAAIAIQNAKLFQQVHHLSMTDPLTSLSNRRQLERDLAREFAAAQRGRRLTVVMFDLNGFKPYNDRYGHLAGDEAIRRFGAALAAETRAMNIAARYGGDEFISVLADAGRAEAEIFVGRLRQRFPGPQAKEQERELGFSAGIAEYTPGMNAPAQLIAAADVALYEEKMLRKKPKMPEPISAQALASMLSST